MANQSQPDDNPAPVLDQISTRWPMIEDPVQFVLRYAPAIRSYLHALLKDTNVAEEVSQDFLVRGLLRGFGSATPLRGRFRHYPGLRTEGRQGEPRALTKLCHTNSLE